MTVFQTNVARATVDMDYLGATAIQNVFHLQLTTASLTEAEALDDIVEILEALYILIAAIIRATQTVQRIRAVNVTSNSDIGEGNFVDDTPFTSATGSTAPQVAYGITLTTPNLSIRGRKFFGVVVEDMIGESGNLTTTALNALGDVIDFMSGPIAASNGTWVFGVVRSVDGGFSIFNGGTVSLNAVTQRRRRVGVGI